MSLFPLKKKNILKNIKCWLLHLVYLFLFSKYRKLSYCVTWWSSAMRILGHMALSLPKLSCNKCMERESRGMAFLYIPSQVLHPPAESLCFYISVIGSHRSFITPAVSKACMLQNLVLVWLCSSTRLKKNHTEQNLRGLILPILHLSTEAQKE